MRVRRAFLRPGAGYAWASGPYAAEVDLTIPFKDATRFWAGQSALFFSIFVSLPDWVADDFVLSDSDEFLIRRGSFLKCLALHQNGSPQIAVGSVATFPQVCRKMADRPNLTQRWGWCRTTAR